MKASQFVRTFSAAAFLSVAAAIPARAQQTYNFDYYCIMGSFQACASVRLTSATTTVLDPVSHRQSYVLKMYVWNLNGTEGVQHTMTSIGLYHSGEAYDWSGNLNSYHVDYVTSGGSSNISSYWTNQGGNDIGNLGGVRLELKEGTQGNRGIIGCTDPGGLIKWATCFNGGSSFNPDAEHGDAPYVVFTFNLSRQFALNSSTQVRWHSQQLPDGSSLKCDTGGAGDYPDCSNHPPTTVPEPTTIALMGTGLIGVVGAARRRRNGTKS